MSENTARDDYKYSNWQKFAHLSLFKKEREKKRKTNRNHKASRKNECAHYPTQLALCKYDAIVQ